ncbi:transglycosylase-like protein with SLT domain [Keratinibaculum paraultunense]|uniref:Transglycosylase-like protein with SLT domain n=1 Tax=Keratinibaculum paraultunense TaxID=1278232 RepID=A0A4R3KVY7_9FIRM|nr:transglycosylase SLT domain-containing protein [Keratinibaculum paraultunense]QQY79165.1 transglycosylase SLT domain-containing protein [Keratinibaculum paraultunense]TCS88549.1 transglycosylase-like protein with SLT domain [Keratinibaculum paraultunense]
MSKKAASFLLVFLILFSFINVGLCAKNNLSRKEVESLIEEVAIKRGIPSVILKSIASVESSLEQFDRRGRPKVSRGGHIGIMQVNGKNKKYNSTKLRNDPLYNIESGADHLLDKWEYANKNMPQIGNMDPNILEHWYFALWAYNGLLDRNNPNANYNKTYQDKIYRVALKEFGQKITPIDRKYLPKKGVPKKGKKIPTPKVYHEGDILKYSPEDKVVVDGKNFLSLLDKPYGKEIGRVKKDSTMTIIEGPNLNNGFYFYKVQVDGKKDIGWVYGNWISKVNDS